MKIKNKVTQLYAEGIETNPFCLTSSRLVFMHISYNIPKEKKNLCVLGSKSLAVQNEEHGNRVWIASPPMLCWHL